MTFIVFITQILHLDKYGIGFMPVLVYLVNEKPISGLNMNSAVKVLKNLIVLIMRDVPMYESFQWFL